MDGVDIFMTKSMDELMLSLKKISKTIENANKGYEPKCKICNSKFQDKIEDMYEWEHPFREMKDFLEGKGENVSLMALSRHFKNHYPTRKVYLNNVKKMENKAIQDAIKTYPRLEKIFLEKFTEPDYDKPIYNNNGDIIKFEWCERSNIDRFLKEDGFCLTGLHFCSNIPKKEVLYMEDTLSKIDSEIKNIERYSYHDHEKMELLNKKFECLSCRDLEHEVTLDYLIHSFSKNVLGVNIEPEKFKEIFYHDAKWDPDKMDNIFNELKFTNNNNPQNP